MDGEVLFCTSFASELLRCLSLARSQKVMAEIHARECGEHQGRRKLYEHLLAHGYYWPSMKQDAADYVRQCHICQVHASLIHSHHNLLQNMKTPWSFHTWGLDLIGPIHPSSEGYIWILVATEYFTKRVEAVSLYKATGLAMLNFIKEHIICRFEIPYKIANDNGIPFVNQYVQRLLDTYKIKHRKSTPYYP
ncbi:hypothetical protein SLE2022_059190 [Rubroshorea leprosula]